MNVVDGRAFCFEPPLSSRRGALLAFLRYPLGMTAAVQAVLEQARRLTAEERAELASALLDLDEELDRPVLTREELDRQLASSIAQARRGEFVDEVSVLAELELDR